MADSELGVEEEEEVMSGVSRPRYDTSYSDDPESVIREITDMQLQERCYGDGLRSEVQFVWDVEDEDPPRGAPSAAHRAAHEMLRNAHDDQADRADTHEKQLTELRNLLSKQATRFQEFQEKIWAVSTHWLPAMAQWLMPLRKH